MQFEHLPVEVLLEIFKHLIPIHLINLSTCSHYMYALCQDNKIWEYMGLRYSDILSKDDTMVTWKQHIFKLSKFSHTQHCTIKLIQQLFPSFIYDLRVHTTILHQNKPISLTHICILIDKYNMGTSKSNWINTWHRLEIRLFTLCHTIICNSPLSHLFQLFVDSSGVMYTFPTNHKICNKRKTDWINNGTSPFSTGTCIYLNRAQLDMLEYL